MKRERTKRALGLVLIGMMVLAAAGCNTTAPTEPVNGHDGDDPGTVGPALPPADKLDFDFSFFDGADKEMRDSKENFFNAAIRVTVIQVVTRFVLTPPVAAFAAAIHTIPSPQDDGSWIWIYTWVDGAEEAQIRLRGEDLGDKVAWELRVKALDASPPLDNVVWFEGYTWNEGDRGEWDFHNPEREGNPVVATLAWRAEGDHEELVFTDLDENPGDVLAYYKDGDIARIENEDVSEDEVWFIEVDESNGSGSLRAPDYRDGVRSCWDDRQDDVDCGPAS